MKSPIFLLLLLVILLMALLILGLGGDRAKAQSMGTSHQQGQQVASGLLGNTQAAARATDPNQVPQFQREPSFPADASTIPSVLEGRAGAALRSSGGGQFLLESHHQRPTFKIDVERDPLFTNAQAAIQNPHRTLDVTVRAEGREGADAASTVVCEEAGDPYPEACLLRLHPEIRERVEKVFVRCHHWGWNDARKCFDEYLSHPYHLDSHDWIGHCDCNMRYESWRNEYRYQKRFEATNGDGSVSASPPTAMSAQEYQAYLERTRTAAGQVPPPRIVSPESQHSSCLVLEELVERGICQYGEKVCAEPRQTRVIQGVPVTRECWAYRQTYSCIEPLQSAHTCQALRAKGCVQVGSVCKTERHGVCLVYQQTYSCPKGKGGLQKFSTQGGKSLFCLTGNCAESSYEANGELFEALSHLAVLKEAQDDIRANLGIFKGEGLQCSRNCVNFRDCCGHGKGWGVSIGFARCSGQEKDLALRRSQNKCVMVGTYCARKVLGKCIEKKTTFCCFGTKLARLIQEAGHQQLGLSWGTPEQRNCQGLTPDQLSRIDFSRVDFSELFQDIASNFRPKSPRELSQSISAERLQDNMTRLAASKTKRIREAGQRQKGVTQ